MYLFTVNNNIQQYWFIDCNKYPALNYAARYNDITTNLIHF